MKYLSNMQTTFQNGLSGICKINKILTVFAQEGWTISDCTLSGGRRVLLVRGIEALDHNSDISNGGKMQH